MDALVVIRKKICANHGSIRDAETNFLDSFFSKIILVATFFLIIVTPADPLFPIIKKIKKAGTLSGRERKRKNSRQGNWRNSRCVCVCACVRYMERGGRFRWHSAADFSFSRQARVIFAVKRKT